MKMPKAGKQASLPMSQVAAPGVAGVYVYSLPHYIRHPYDPATGMTLYKVGRSDSAVIKRFIAQTRTTSLPEDPILLRIYATNGNSAPVEAKFHRLLESAGHRRSDGKAAGTEWFMTRIEFLDEIARTLCLPIGIVDHV